MRVQRGHHTIFVERQYPERPQSSVTMEERLDEERRVRLENIHEAWKFLKRTGNEDLAEVLGL